VAACVGNAAEWYDFAIYGSLATVIGLVFFPPQHLATALSAAFATYGTAFLVRPLGALLFGRLGDAQGRRTVLVRVVFLMAGATTCVALLPGYATIGLLAPVVLVLLRAAQGLAAGGELGVASVFILENAHHASSDCCRRAGPPLRSCRRTPSGYRFNRGAVDSPVADEPSGGTRIARQPLRGRGVGRRSGGWRTLRGDAWRAFAVPVRSTGFALTAGLATALIGGTAPLVAQLLVTLVDLEAAPGIYVAVMAGLALIALRSWPETAFRELI
jgi:hypothetical protein